LHFPLFLHFFDTLSLQTDVCTASGDGMAGRRSTLHGAHVPYYTVVVSQKCTNFATV